MKNKNFRHAAKAAALLCVLVLAACGGGSDNDGTDAIKPVISEETARLRRMAEPAPAPASAPAAPGAASATPPAAN